MSHNTLILTCIFTIIFIIILIAHLCAEIRHLKGLKHITKPFLMPLLAIVYATGSPSPDTLIICALLLGAVGDIFMMFSSRKKLFLAGAGTFLAGHICYITAFVTSVGEYAGFSWIYVFLVLPQGFILFGWCLPKIFGKMGKMEIPLIIYGVVLFIMASSAILRSAQFTGISFWFPYIGAVLFALSDAMIVVDKFHKKITDARIYVMLTYALGQFLIVAGLIPAG